MRLKVLSVLAALIALAPFVPSARAGAIRYAGRELHKGSIAAVQKTSDATGTAVGSVEDASKATGTALKDGTGTLRKSAVSAPGVAVRETKTAASKIWNAVW
jgi:hypothetical protein